MSRIFTLAVENTVLPLRRFPSARSLASSVGIIETRPGLLVTSQRRQDGAGYRKIIFSGSRLKGCIMLGDINGGGMVESLIRRQQEVDENFIQKVVINRNQWPECVGIRRYI